MYLIKDKNNRFIKKTIDNQITFTNNESLADAFSSEREANDVIRKSFTKKNRKNYKAVWRDINPVAEPTTGQQQNSENTNGTYMLSIKGFDEVMTTTDYGWVLSHPKSKNTCRSCRSMTA